MKQLVKGSSALTAVSLCEMIMRFVRTKCIAIYLGPAGTGFLAQLTIFFELLRVWGDLGSRRGVIKQIAEQRQSGRESIAYGEIIKTSYFLALVASSVTGLLVTLFAKQISQSLYGDPSHSLFIISLALLLPLASLSTVTASVLKGNLEYLSFAKYTLFAYLSVMLVTPFLIYFLRDWGAVLAQALFFIFPLIAYLIFNKKSRILRFSKKINFPALKEQFSYGFVQIYQDSLAQFTRVAVAAWIVKSLGLQTMGIFQVIITFSTIYMAIPIQAMSGYVMPVIAAATNSKEIVKGVNESLRFLMFILAPAVVFIMIWPQGFICLFFSKEFIPAALPLQIQLLGTLFVIIGFPFGVALQARGQLKALMVSATVSPLLYLAFVWLLFDVGQLTGVAVAYLISNLITTLVQFFLNRHYYGVYLVPKNQRLLVTSCVWLGLAFIAGAFVKVLAFQVLVALLGIPWFLISSKEHERDFLVSKWNDFKILGKSFSQKRLKFLRL